MNQALSLIGLAALAVGCATQTPSIKTQSAPLGDTTEKVGYQTSPAQVQEETEESTSVNYYTLVDKVTCSALSSSELEQRNLTCFVNLPNLIQRYDGWEYKFFEAESAGPKDNKLGLFEYVTALIDECYSLELCVEPSSEYEKEVLGAILLKVAKKNIQMAIPADINRDCYLSQADDVYPVGNPDGIITLEDLTQFQATATSTRPVKCNYYGPLEVKPEGESK